MLGDDIEWLGGGGGVDRAEGGGGGAEVVGGPFFAGKLGPSELCD